MTEADSTLLKAWLTKVLLGTERIKLQVAALPQHNDGSLSSSCGWTGEIDQLEMLVGDLEMDQGEQLAASAGPPSDSKPPRPSHTRDLSGSHPPRKVIVLGLEITCVCGSCDLAMLAKLRDTTTPLRVAPRT